MYNAVYPNFKSSYKSYQSNIEKLKSWRSRQTDATYDDAKSMVSDFLSSGKPKPELKAEESDKSQTRRCGAPEDLLDGRYESTNLDQVWTSDVTHIGKYSLLLVMDQSTRQIIFNKLFDVYPTSSDVAILLSACVYDRQPPEMFHSDSEDIFSSKSEDHPVTKLWLSLGVKISRGHHGFHNQVQERVNRTIKDILRVKLGEPAPVSKVRRSDPRSSWAKFSRLCLSSAHNLIILVIEEYNNRHHGTLGASPNMVETSIAVYGKGVSMLARKHSPMAQQIAKFRRTVVQRYAGDWQNFFIDWYLSNTKSHRDTQARIEESARIHKVNFQKVIETLELEKPGVKKAVLRAGVSTQWTKGSLRKQLTQLESSLSYIMAREASREHTELDMRDKIARRRARIRQPRLFGKEYVVCLSLAAGASFENIRDRVCLLLLFLTGLRVHSLLLTKGSHLSSLLSHQEDGRSPTDCVLHYPGINSSTPIRVPLPLDSRPYIKALVQRSCTLRRLLSARGPDDPVMSRTEGGSELLDVNTLKSRLDSILSKASLVTGKYLRTDSYKIGFTQRALALGGDRREPPTDHRTAIIDQNVQGHSDFRTTASYSRHPYRHSQLTKALKA